ncbi:MAG: D-alanyl-D-alanine carboxypeptidase/D-alanyl-D-alanine-endopeptidase [Ignavibacteriales bacterium]|nr:MAG: D-alanyl-D-alanine carboxypeptidase/D-alanyl-D-alanine-endopeptidase [Ignavibacteriales bacterium]
MLKIKSQLILLLLVFISCELFPQKLSIKSSLDSLFKDELFESTIAAVDIYNLTEKKVIYQRNNKLLLNPASNMKLLTSVAGILFLGHDYEFQTSLYYTGKIENDTLFGDLYVVGGCDPDFKLIDLQQFVKAVKSSAIKFITGKLYGDVSFKDDVYWGNGWMWDDAPFSDAPYLSALNINDNIVSVSVQPSEPGQVAYATVYPSTAYVSVINECKTSSSAGLNNFYVTRDYKNLSNVIYIGGNITDRSDHDSSSTHFNLTVVNPEKYFLTLFREELARNGIVIEDEPELFFLPYDAVHLATVSRPFEEVLVNLNKSSDNLSAEMVLYAMGNKYHGKPGHASNGLKMLNSLILMSGMKPLQYSIADGSGVSRYNLVSSELLLAILKYLYQENASAFNYLYNSLPIGGVDGTLSKRMIGTTAEKNIRAKTGTLKGVSSLSGYAWAKNGTLLAFSIIIHNFTRPVDDIRKLQDEICRMMTSYDLN